MTMIVFENQTDFLIEQDIFDQVVAVLSEDKIESSSELNLLLTADDTIKELNRRYRGKDSNTDVLSFPSQIPNLPFLGDIIIDTSVADQQKGYHSLEKELQSLFLHGVLHLLGYDHISAHQKMIMQQKENMYKQKLNLGD